MNQPAPRKLTRTLDGLLARFDYAGLLVLVVEPDAESRGALVRALVGLGLPQPLEAASAAEATAQAAELEPHGGDAFDERFDDLLGKIRRTRTVRGAGSHTAPPQTDPDTKPVLAT